MDYTALWGAIIAGAIAVGVLFKSMKTWIERQDVKIVELQKNAEDCDKRYHALDAKFRSLADNCPVTHAPCPLRALFK